MTGDDVRRAALSDAVKAIAHRIALLDQAAPTLGAVRSLTLAGQREGLVSALATVAAMLEDLDDAA